jgi:hypothetical protein
MSAGGLLSANANQRLTMSSYRTPALALLAAVVGLLAGWLGLQPVAINVAVDSPKFAATVVPIGFGPFASAPVAGDVPGVAEGRLRDRLGFVGLRGRIRAELDRRAGLPEGHADRITEEQQEKGKELVGRLGDGHLLELLIRYGPEIIALVKAVLMLIAVL